MRLNEGTGELIPCERGFAGQVASRQGIRFLHKCAFGHGISVAGHRRRSALDSAHDLLKCDQGLSDVRPLHAALHLGGSVCVSQRVRRSRHAEQSAAALQDRPTTFIDVVTTRVRDREIVGREVVRWGLIPTWRKKPRREGPTTFNARAETVAQKPMFRGAFKYRRCIIPASGFYEWTSGKDARQAHLFTAADGPPVLAFAGLWDRWIGSRQLRRSDLCHDYRLRRECVDGAVSRPQAGAVGGTEFQCMAGWLARSRCAETRRRGRASRMSRRLNRAGFGDDDPTIIAPDLIPLAT